MVQILDIIVVIIIRMISLKIIPIQDILRNPPQGIKQLVVIRILMQLLEDMGRQQLINMDNLMEMQHSRMVL